MSTENKRSEIGQDDVKMKDNRWSSKMAHKVKLFALNPDDLSLIPGPHMVEG